MTPQALPTKLPKPEKPSRPARPPARRRALAVLGCILALGITATTRNDAYALDAGARCQIEKGKQAAKYAACMHIAETILARTAGTCSPGGEACYRGADCAPSAQCLKDTQPGTPFGDAAARCAVRFDERWGSAEAATTPSQCLDGLAPDDVRREIDDSVASIASGLAGDGLANCGPGLEECTATLGSCEASLGDVQTNLAACSGMPESCLGNSGPGCEPPASAPSGLVAVPADGSVSLDWASLPEADYYGIERAAGASAFALVGRTSSTTFSDDTVVNDTEYRYRVFGVHSGHAGPSCEPVPVTPQALPSAPSGVTATSTDGGAIVQWTRGAGAAATHVLRGPSAAGPWSEAAVTSGETHSDAALQNGSPYWYVLFSSNPVGDSPRTAPVQAVPIAAPADLAAVPSDGQVSLFWTPSIGATSYEVQRAADATGPWSVAGTAAVPRFAEGGLPNDVPTWHRVVARNDVAASQPTAPVSATPSAALVALPPDEDPTANKVGLNVWFNRDWGAAFAFVDVMKESRPWQDAANWNLPVGGVDDQGWPTADASTVIFSGDAVDFNGTYHLVFEGQADVSLLWCPGSVTNKTWDAATNTTRADVTFAMTPSNRSVGLVLRNTRRLPGGPLGSGFRNLRLFRPGYPADGSVVFTSPFLTALGKAGTVRMMEWAGGSSDFVQHWADRSTPLKATQGGLPAPPYTGPDGQTWQTQLGVALEHRIQLCNELMTDCWINVPPVADDEYIQNLALALRFGTDGTNPYTSPQEHPLFPPLNPALRVYLEYSNENWNSGSGFLAFHAIKGICAHLDASHPVMIPTPDSIYAAMWRYPAWRTWVISEVFRQVFGDGAMMTRVRPVLMTQRGNGQSTLSTALLWFDGFLRGLPTPRSVSDVLWGAGGSGYWGATNMVSAVPDQFFAPGNIPDAQTVRDFTVDTVWAGNYGLRHVAYEGGPGLSFSAADNRTLNADPRMKSAVEAVHDVWSGLGGDLLVYYTVRGPSEWEFTSHINNADSAKLLALDELQARPKAPVTVGSALPGSVVIPDAGPIVTRTGYGYRVTIDGLSCEAGFATGQMIAAAAHAPTAFAGTLKLRAYSSSTTRVAVWINGQRKGEVVLPALAGTWHLYDSSTLAVDIPAGLVVIRLELLEGAFAIRSVEVQG